tara:strand:- start:86 stop:376 length:291 start_codon:yes stop_codon:yes gene_type:complete
MLEIVYRVKNKHGKLVGETMDLKLAKILDTNTDILYFLANILEESCGLDEAVSEKVAEALMADDVRADIIKQLKSVKTLPVESSGVTGGVKETSEE